MLRGILVGVLLVAGASPVSAQLPAAASKIVPSVPDITRTDLDTKISPCHDFHQYATGGWYRHTPESVRKDATHGPDQGRAGVTLRRLVAQAPALASTTKDPTLKAVGYFYGSCVADRSGAAAGAVGDTARASYCFRATRQHLDRALFELLLEYVWPAAARAEVKRFWPNMQAASSALFQGSKVLPDSAKAELVALSTQIRLYAGEAGRRDSTTEWWRLVAKAPATPGRRPLDAPLSAETWVYRDYTALALSTTDFAGNVARLTAAPDTVRPPALPGPVKDRAPTQLVLLDVLLGDQRYEAGVGNKQAAAPLSMLIPPIIDGVIDIGAWYGLLGPVEGHEMSHGTLRGGGQRTPLTTLTPAALDAFAGELFQGQLQHFSHPFDDAFGVLVAHGAFMRAVQGPSWPSIDGFTPEQRFFFGVARGWRAGPVAVNPVDNAQSRWRVLTNGTLSAMPAFAKAFGCKAGDPMAGGKIWYLDPWGDLAVTAEERRQLYQSYVENTFGFWSPLDFGGGSAGKDTLSAEQKTTLAQLGTTQKARQQALIDSLGASVEFPAGARRILHLLAQQIGERRGVLTAEQQARLDPQIQRWVQLYGSKGDGVAVPGVPPAAKQS